MKKIQIGISLSAVIIALIHIFIPDVSIDSITLTLFIVAIVPWVAPLFKSLEFPGGMKIEFQELLERTKDADKIGLLSKDFELSDSNQYFFQSVADEEPNLALAGLRIEIEKKLKTIAEGMGLKEKNRAIGWYLNILSDNGVLTGEERGVLQDIVGLLNRAVHGADVDYSAAHWAIETGPRILKALDEKLDYLKKEN